MILPTPVSTLEAETAAGGESFNCETVMTAPVINGGGRRRQTGSRLTQEIIEGNILGY